VFAFQLTSRGFEFFCYRSTKWSTAGLRTEVCLGHEASQFLLTSFTAVELSQHEFEMREWDLALRLLGKGAKQHLLGPCAMRKGGKKLVG
jgi:hypothetical protein